LSRVRAIAAIQRVDSTDGMQRSHLLFTSSDPFPQRLLFRLEGFADLFTRPTWSNVLLLVAGVVLRQAGAPSRRRCASWDEITTPASALSTVSSTARRGRPGRWRAGC